jgi:predicted 3-demethylubiquinone-9 3-methyltransferase (glyoxalase superfamily)
MRAVTTFLMFEGQAEEALRFYTSVFDDGEIVSLTRYDDAGPGTPGTVERAVFSLGGREFMAIDSSVEHAFTFTPSISLFVDCDSEAEVDSLAGALGEGGAVLMPVGAYGFSRRFGWVTDRFGVSWQLNCA